MSTHDATLTYLRPASCAAAAASAMVAPWRNASGATLISMGRFAPAMTSAPALSITAMARFDGVPPNMSVRMIDPRLAASAAGSL